jgi:hypothetical protein
MFSARSLRDPQKQPPQKSLIGIGFRGEGIRNSAPIERISYQSPWIAASLRSSQ